MVDIENYIVDKLSKALKQQFSDIFVKSEYTKNVSQFPCVLVQERTNTVYLDSRDENIENHVNLMYQIDIFSNAIGNKKKECKDILKVVDDTMVNEGFTRIMAEPIDNIEDATIYRYTARYQAIASKAIDGINYIYRN